MIMNEDIHTKSAFPPCDMHTHTGFSDDCDIPMDEMLEGALKKGVKILAVTDHYDPGYPDPEFPFIPDFEGYNTALDSACKKYAGRMEILKGLEIGIMGGQLEAAAKAACDHSYDMIIGSFHCLGTADLYTFDYSQADGPSLVEEFYSYVLRCLKDFDSYDVLGHMSILDRYIGRLYDYSPVEDIIDEILKIIIEGGHGLEINTSSFRYGTGTWLPRESILRKYHRLGGEILTFGSDAHDPAYYLYHFEDAAELARAIGFKYYCVFRKRKPEFLPL